MAEFASKGVAGAGLGLGIAGTALGIYGKCIEYYLVMNMSYNDYYDVATNFGHQGDAEFYFELANAFINDVDGDKYKVEKYFIN